MCKDCPCRTVCGANESGQRILTTHIWQEYLDLVEHLRKTERGKELYAMRKETIERVFADAKKSTPCGIRTTEVWPGFLLG
ncbi:MAG: transposase [Oscillospiraceae bacterium]